MVGKNALFGNQAEKNKLPKGVTGMKLSRTDRFFQGSGHGKFQFANFVPRQLKPCQVISLDPQVHSVELFTMAGQRFNRGRAQGAFYRTWVIDFHHGCLPLMKS
jgi:hypothetical protein